MSNDVSGAATIANVVKQVTQLKEAQANDGVQASPPDTPSVETSTSTRTEKKESGGGCASILKVFVVVAAVAVSIWQPQLAPVAISAATSALNPQAPAAGGPQPKSDASVSGVKAEIEKFVEEMPQWKFFRDSPELVAIGLSDEQSQRLRG